MSTPSDKTLRLERTKLNQQPPRGRNTTLGIALVAGIAAALLAYLVLTRPSQTAATPQTVVVAPTLQMEVVASKDIPARAIIDSSMVSMKSVNPSQLTPNSVAVTESVLGKMALNPIPMGTAITSDSIADKKPYGIAGYISPGLRAVTIALDPISSVAGFVKPGDHVDILGTFDAGHNQSLTRTVLQNVLLVATGTQAIAATAPDSSGAIGSGGATAVSPDGPTPKAQEVPNATLMLSPIDSQKVVVAASKGKLTLTLRPAGDLDMTPIASVHSSAVTTVPPDSGAAAPQRSAPPPPVPVRPLPPMPPVNPLVSVTVIRGSDAKSVSVSP